MSQFIFRQAIDNRTPAAFPVNCLSFSKTKRVGTDGFFIRINFKIRNGKKKVNRCNVFFKNIFRISPGDKHIGAEGFGRMTGADWKGVGQIPAGSDQ